MARYIDADEARIDADERGFDFWTTDTDINNVQKFLDEQPTADVAPVVHAQWKRLDYPKRKLDWYRCTNCGRERVRSYDDPHSIYELLPYCNCGAKMDDGGAR